MAALLWVAPASAQTDVSQYNVPFSFVAGNEVIPAGHYRVTVDTNFYLCRLEPTGSTGIHVIRLVPGATARKIGKSSAGVMQFAKLDGQYFFTGIWKTGEVSGHETLASRRFNQLAKAKPAAETVTVGPESDLR
jgi:hypothetical protein